MPWLDLCLCRNVYTSLRFCNGTRVLTNCSAAIYPLITPMTHIKVTIFHIKKHKQNWHHSSCLYFETHSVLWVSRVATQETALSFWCQGLLVRGVRLTGHFAPGQGEKVELLCYSHVGLRITAHAVNFGADECWARLQTGWFLSPVVLRCS